MKNIFNELKTKLSKAILHDVKLLLAMYPDKRFYGLNLATDSSCQSVYLALSSYEGLQQKAVNENYASTDEMKFLAWFLEDVNIDELGENSQINQVSEYLFYNEDVFHSQYEDQYGEDYFDQYKDDIVAIFCEAFEESAVLELFDNEIFICISDSESDEKLENLTSERLNSKEKHQLFLKRFDEWIL
ncbi:MAG: DUF4303 domain-containing protein [Capnocytophaga sp.]|nr:DUF4303 domain-containing protein [Capnocytophaga sp.]